MERKTKKLIFDREIEIYDKNFVFEENKKINEENDFKNKFKNKFQKKYFYEIVDEYLFLQTFEKVYVVNKYKILEDKSFNVEVSEAYLEPLIKTFFNKIKPNAMIKDLEWLNERFIFMPEDPRRRIN